MSAWGSGGFKSCDALLKRVEENDDKLVELVILPMKTFGGAELDRLSNAIASGKNTNLKSISASGHSIPTDALKRFGSALSQQTKKFDGIAHIAIGSRDMGDEGVVALCEGLDGSNGGLIQTLDLGWKEIGIDGACKIGASFAKSKHLSHLDLSRNEKVGCQGISSMCAAAKKSTEGSCTPFSALKHLNLSECNISAPGIRSLAEYLGQRDMNDEPYKRFELNLSSNSIGAEGCDSIKVMLFRQSVGSVLSKLKLSQCSVADVGIAKLSAAAKLCPCTGLTVLDISDNSITHVGAESLADSLSKCWPDVVELNLSKNNIGSTGVVKLMKCLRQRSDISNDHPVISNETVMVVKSVLQDVDADSDLNGSLKSLDLTETNCGIEGACAALMSGELTSLRLFNNKLGSDGFYSIAPLLQGGHPSIEHLDLGGNSADEKSVVALLDAIANAGDNENKLSVLEIGGNAFGDEADAALKRMKKVWPKLDVACDKPVQREVIEE